MRERFRAGQSSTSRLGVAILCAVALLLPVGKSALRAADNPTLAGTWKLNQDQSDNPREKMREAMGNGGGGGGYQGNGGGFGGGQRGGGGMGQGRRGGQGGGMQNLSQITVEQNGNSVKITGESGNVIAQTADNSQSSGQDNNQQAGNNFRQPAIAQWKDNQLVAETSGRNGAKTTRTFTLSPDGKQLYFTTQINNPRFTQPVTFRLVYDPAKAQ